MLRTLKDLALNLRAAALLLLSLLAYAGSGRTPAAGLGSMIRIHARTNGGATSLLAALVRLARPPRRLDDVLDTKDHFAALSAGDADTIVRDLSTEGFAVSPLRLPEDLVGRLRAFADATPGYPTSAAGLTGPRQRYDRSDRDVAKFHFDRNDLAAQADIQRLAADARLIAIAQHHLGCLPVLDSIAMWWSTPHLERAADEIAQTFHMDYDRLRWLKVFIYLTDVTPESGPHVFVRHSHLREPRRAELIRRGYVRLPDEDVLRVYRADEIASICGPAGTVLFEDTSGFHKGTMPESRERLMLEFQFSCNLFGANYERIQPAAPVDARLDALRRALPAVYANFDWA
jgi:hypothetical protein